MGLGFLRELFGVRLTLCFIDLLYVLPVEKAILKEVNRPLFPNKNTEVSCQLIRT